ncbi:MAG: amidohydrolase family protein [Oscillospiraceae bacterium]|nr:amidohydrolase family protein [Oscillospiraceae bacterium]
MRLYKNAVFHSGISEADRFSYLLEDKGRIVGTFNERPEGKFEEIDLKGLHVYPCLIDGHTHMLLSIAVMAMGFNICEITADGVEPKNLAGIGERLRNYADKQPKDAVIACNNYILTALEEQRLPNRHELDDWGGGRPVVVYNIDGHSTALSTAMLRLCGLDENGSGVLSGEENERAQGRIMDKVSSMMSLKKLAKGIANYQNTCARYGICMTGALEGQGDSPKDASTALILKLARYFDIDVRAYLQYRELKRVEPFTKYMAHPRVGGCGDWELDGSCGSHSAAFSLPYKDTGELADCYYSQEDIDALCREADAKGWQIASHAIGDVAISRLVQALEGCDSQTFHRIEHAEFMDDESFEKISSGRWALMMQPGYSWIDKRYLHTYSQFMADDMIKNMRLKSLLDAGITVCGSSDSPVQDMDPWLQMLGMVQFYNEAESITPYEAFCCYTKNAARAMLEEENYGTLEKGKYASFFTAQEDIFSLSPEKLVAVRPAETYYKGKAYKEKSGSLAEFASMFLKKAKKI